MLDPTTQFWKKETIEQARSLADRELLLKIERLMDKHNRGTQTGDYVMMTEARNDLFNLVRNAKEEKKDAINSLSEMFLCGSCRRKNEGITNKYGLF